MTVQQNIALGGIGLSQPIAFASQQPAESSDFDKLLSEMMAFDTECLDLKPSNKIQELMASIQDSLEESELDKTLSEEERAVLLGMLCSYEPKLIRQDLLVSGIQSSVSDSEEKRTTNDFQALCMANPMEEDLVKETMNREILRAHGDGPVKNFSEKKSNWFIDELDVLQGLKALGDNKEKLGITSEPASQIKLVERNGPHKISAWKIKQADIPLTQKDSSGGREKTDKSIHNFSYAGKEFQEIALTKSSDFPTVNLEQIYSILDKGILETKEKQKTTLTIKLSPEELGSLKIRLEVKEGMVRGNILVDNETTKQVMESHLQDMKDQIKNQGLSLESLDISFDKDFQRNFRESAREQKRQTGKDYGSIQLMKTERDVKENLLNILNAQQRVNILA